jgi:predicted MFS family arabinose efflux permease
MTEGQAGQAIAISGRLRRAHQPDHLVGDPRARPPARAAGLTGLMILSGLVVALAPNAADLHGGRALVGVVIGGFWSMSAATVMRLVPADQVPRALGVLNGGNALATTIAAPLGSFLGQYIGWRGAFFVVVPLAS